MYQRLSIAQLFFLCLEDALLSQHQERDFNDNLILLRLWYPEKANLPWCEQDEEGPALSLQIGCVIILAP